MRRSGIFHDDRISARFADERHGAAGRWFRFHERGQRESDDAGLMRRREASIGDVAIEKHERRFT